MRPFRRLFALADLVGAIAVIGLAPSAASARGTLPRAQSGVTTTTTPATPLPPARAVLDDDFEPTLRVNFGLGRDPLTRTITIRFDRGGLGDVSVELLGDLRPDDEDQPAFPAGEVTPSSLRAGAPSR